MKKFRFFALACILGLAGIGAPAQSIVQSMGFAVVASYPAVIGTNEVSPGVTNYHTILRTFIITKNDIVKAIALDQFGVPAWTNWAGAALFRRLNLATGNVQMFLALNGKETNVSQYFTNSFTGGFNPQFSGPIPDSITYISNQNMAFTQISPIYSSFSSNASYTGPYPMYTISPTNTNTVYSASRYVNMSAYHYFTVVTTNLVMNLLGVDSYGLGSGTVDNIFGVGTNSTNEYYVPNEQIRVIGTAFVNTTTNAYTTNVAMNMSNAVFRSGPAAGLWDIYPAVRSPIQAP